MIDPNAHEMRALAAAGAQGGAYVEALAKTCLLYTSDAADE